MGTELFVVVTHTTTGHSSKVYFAALEAARAYAAQRLQCRDCDRLEIFHDHELIDVEEVIADTTTR